MDGAVCAVARRVVRGGPGGVPDGSLMSPRWRVRIEMGPVACPAACPCVASSDGANRDGLGVQPDGSLVSFAGIASADRSDRDGPGVLPDSSLVSLVGIASVTAKWLAQQLHHR